jgi:hypothetical protein
VKFPLPLTPSRQGREDPYYPLPRRERVRVRVKFAPPCRDCFPPDKSGGRNDIMAGELTRGKAFLGLIEKAERARVRVNICYPLP